MTKYVLTVLACVVAVLMILFGAWRHGYSTGYAARDRTAQEQIGALERQILAAERKATQQREQGRVLADRLATELADAKDKITTLQGRIDHEIRRTASATRRCMSGDLAGLLNQLSPIRESVRDDTVAPGTAPAGADAAPAAPAADSGGYASERSVATALSEARSGYETCRTGLHKLQDYVREITRSD